MSLKYKFTDLILKPLNNIWIWIWSLLDCKFKRMCVLASLHAVLLDCDDSESDRIRELNDKFKLVHDVNALRLPTLIGPVLWRKILPIEQIDTSTDRYIQRLMRMTPCWLRYDDDQSFKQDLTALMDYCTRRSAVA